MAQQQFKRADGDKIALYLYPRDASRVRSSKSLGKINEVESLREEVRIKDARVFERRVQAIIDHSVFL